MTPQEFVIWLDGFVTASHNWNLTPKAWDELKDKLKTVNKPNSFIGAPYTTGGNDDIKEF